MYWNISFWRMERICLSINRNMRCIETQVHWPDDGKESGLIETWDVLKRRFFLFRHVILQRLIETWDVLKRVLKTGIDAPLLGLIETWDVLKRRSRSASKTKRWINRNMRCIETQQYQQRLRGMNRLIETWDVLKQNT